MEKCLQYKDKIFDLLFPPKITFEKLCMSYDKTKLFLYTFGRFLIYYLLFKYLIYIKLINPSYNVFKLFGFLVLLILIVASFSLVILVALKRQKFDKKEEKDMTQEEIELRDEVTLPDIFLLSHKYNPKNVYIPPEHRESK